ncbi:pyrimidine operon attenuation protein/uracil phosphoribosyltransferase [Sulfuritortus calidifontis]|uniref:Pyrimidine operon attenuation protein/uracil phosphoribosyltransferase n=1 Tax=Sulfuritortus calidifontis TaxID=1914471 RepID=A0A4R3JXV2_9PROT|nr:bifunctional pyr operon transcriptional regulator/uracil phosphoribosyltransferase PyrR [Sulfuritortus calidifontis]TCS73372.1 pyrimidine operon attenuation protein/uracil phosphoribosyltransferase [Sulfuritortus calidifontis]
MQLPDPNELIDRLAEQIRPSLSPECALVGIHTGGVWVMEALAERLGADLPRGSLDIAFYRDDFSRIGLHPVVKPSHIDFDMEGRRLLLIDDVLYTGRTVRAAMNQLFDYGRPAAIRLAVLVDRGGRELPICADFAGLKLDLPDDRHLSLTRSADGRLGFVQGAA